MHWGASRVNPLSKKTAVVCVTSAGEWEPPQEDCLESTFSAWGMEVWQERTESKREYGMSVLGSPCLLIAVIARETEVWSGAKSVALTWCLLYLSPCRS